MTVEPQIRFWLAALGLLILFVYLFSGILLPFVAGFAIAYFLDPVVDWVEKSKLSRGFATAAVIGLFFALLALLVLLLAPVIESQFIGFVTQLPESIAQIWSAIQPLVDKALMGLGEDQAGEMRLAAAKLLENAVAWLGDVVAGVLSGGVALFNVLSLLLITPVVAFFLLRDWDRIVTRIDDLLPRQGAATIRAQFRLIDTALAGFVRGQATVCLILGTLYAVGWSLVGLEFGLVLGLLTGLLAFVPYAGVMFGVMLAMGMAFGQFWPDSTSIGLVFLVFVVVQALDGAAITPRLIGGRVGLHPVWILFALLGGANLLGFLGVLIAVPCAAMIGVLVRFGIDRYLESGYFASSGAASGATADGGEKSEPAPDPSRP